MEHDEKGDGNMLDSNAKQWICATLLKRDGSAQTKGLVDKDAIWKRKKLQDRVFETASRWTSPNEGGANLNFKRASKPESADIRISFDEAGGSWSMVGTNAKGVAPGDATMNLGWAREDTAEKDFASVVLHEFGHALALLHEHNHPKLELRWKKDVVYADLGSPPNEWSRDDVDFNVFEQYPLNRTKMSDKPDLVSIMIYTIPARWLDGQEAITPSDHLSKGDISFIRQIYP
jgi:hypothetical protein